MNQATELEHALVIIQSGMLLGQLYAARLGQNTLQHSWQHWPKCVIALPAWLV